MILIYIILLIISLWQTSALLKAFSPAPVSMNLVKVVKVANVTDHSYSFKVIDEQPRTSEEFFTSVLRKGSDKKWRFDPYAWDQIKRCGLFANLTADVTTSNDHGDRGDLLFRVRGYELPSFTFAPEIAASPFAKDPTLSGGLTFVDRHFKGLGQKLHVAVTKKESPTESDIHDLPPSYSVVWSDNSIGKSSRISVSFQEDYSLENDLDINQGISGSVLAADRIPSTCKIAPRRNIMLRDIFANIRTMWPFGRSGSGSFMSCELRPYATTVKGVDVSNDGGVSLLSGAKTTVSLTHASGYNADFWVDRGVCHRSGGVHSTSSSSYTRGGFELSTPTLLLNLVPPIRTVKRLFESSSIYVKTADEEGRSSVLSAPILSSKAPAVNDLPSRLASGLSVDTSPKKLLEALLSFRSGINSRLQRKPVTAKDPAPTVADDVIVERGSEPVGLFLRFKSKGLFNYAADPVPILHYADIADGIVRGFVSETNEALLDKEGELHQKRDLSSSYVCLKTEIGLSGPGIPAFLPSAFIDLARYAPSLISPSDVKSPEQRTAGAWGVTLQAQGVKLDLAWPVLSSQQYRRDNEEGSSLSRLLPSLHLGLDSDA